MSQINIRPALLEDAVEIASIHCSSWRDSYANLLEPAYLAGPIEQDRQAIWTTRLTSPVQEQRVLIAENDAGPAAFICVYLDSDARWGSLIDNLHVSPNLRGQQIGAQLMRAAARVICAGASTARQYLWVLEANQAGLRFYKRLGGQIVERGTSEFPALNKAPALRAYWPDASTLTR